MIQGVHAKYPTFLAPLAGWSDAPFRRICKDFGAHVVYTEMVSADGAIREQKKTLALTEFGEFERPIVIQVFGAEPATIARAVEIISRRQPDFIDMNFGCPTRKIVRRGAGAAHLRDLPGMQQAAEAAVQATNIPISAKLRSGWDSNSINVVEAAQRLQDVGVKMIVIHPRTQTQLFKGHADWSLIKAVKEAVTIPVVGNGDIKSAFDAKKMFDETGCDAVMIGRAACGNPWLFQQIRDYLESGLEPVLPSMAERLNVCLRHFNLTVESFGARHAVHAMRKQISLYLKGFPNAGDIRKKVFMLNSCEQVKEFFSEQQNSFSHIADLTV